MRKLNTIQKRGKLNEVYALYKPDPDAGNACHTYVIYKKDNEFILSSLQFQHGERNAEGSIAGILDHELLEIVRDRLKGFQSGPYACRENALALTKIEEALLFMNMRVEDRIERNVLGKNEK